MDGPWARVALVESPVQTEGWAEQLLALAQLFLDWAGPRGYTRHSPEGWRELRHLRERDQGRWWAEVTAGRANRGQRRWVPWQGERLPLGCETEPDPGSELGRGWWPLWGQAGGPGALAGHRWLPPRWGAGWAGSGLPGSW